MGPPKPPLNYWVYEHEIFIRFQARRGDAKYAKISISHLVSKSWVCKVQKRSDILPYKTNIAI